MSAESDAPSPWVVEHLGKVVPGGLVLDIACGSGRHTRHAAQRGYRVVSVDIDIKQMSSLIGNNMVQLVEADLENGPWPFGDQKFDAIIVTNYLWRPLMTQLIGAVANDGFLIYETFALGKSQYGGPSNPDFLLQPGELLEAVNGELTVLAYGHGVKASGSRLSTRQHICAIRDIYEKEFVV